MQPKPFKRSEEWLSITNPKNPQRLRGPVLNNIRDFMDTKRNNPLSPYGSSDKRFSSGGNYSGVVPGLAHAHVTPDLSVVYRVEGGTVYLYGVYSHADLGTGTPSKQAKQQSMAGKFSRMNFNENSIN